MAYLQSNIPHFKCWVRKEYTHNHEKYHGEFIHAMAVAVTTMPTRCLSFQLIFTGAEVDTVEENVHGGAMWARMPITGLAADSDYEGWPEPMPVWAAQPWDCSSHNHSVYVIELDYTLDVNRVFDNLYAPEKPVRKKRRRRKKK